MFFFVGFQEILIILFIMIVFFGADKIPEIARGLGKGIHEIKNASEKIKDEIKKTAKKSNIDLNISDEIKNSVSRIKNEIDEVSNTIRRSK